MNLSKKYKPYYNLDYYCQDIRYNGMPLTIEVKAYVGIISYTYGKPYITFNLFDKAEIEKLLDIQSKINELIEDKSKPVFMKKHWNKFRVNPESEYAGTGTEAEYYNVYSIGMNIEKRDAQKLSGRVIPLSMKIRVKCVSYTEQSKSIKLVLESYNL